MMLRGGGGSEGVTLIFYLNHTLTFGGCGRLGGLFRVDTFQAHSTRPPADADFNCHVCVCVLKTSNS